MVAELRKLTTPRTTKYNSPTRSAAQTAFLLLPNEEALFGGAAGGGKSVGLLEGALQYVDMPGYNAILFRRTFKDLDLPEALMDLTRERLAGSDAHWKPYTWTFPSGATLSFGYLATEVDKLRYQSAAFHYIGFDELTQFTQSQYTYLFSRLRRPEGDTIPLRMRAATNPGGPGHEWVRSYFIDHDPNAPTLDENGNPIDRVFLPAHLEDNPFLDKEAYLRSLQRLDPVTRAQLLRGDWEARAQGAIFAGHWFQLVDVAPAAPMTVRYWDLAATKAEVGKEDPDWSVGCLLGLSDDGYFTVLDVRRIRDTPKQVEQLIRHTADMDPDDTIVWVEREPGSAGKGYVDHLRGDVLPDKGIYEDKVTGDKVMRAHPAASHAEAGFIRILRGPWNRAFLDELEAFPIGTHDDQVDAFSGAYRMLAQSAVTYGSSPF